MASTSPNDSNPSAPDATLAKFHYFPKLPIELRLKIWGLTIEPRTIEVLFSQDRRRYEHKFISQTPPLLHVHSESRIEGLRYYELSKQHCKKTRTLCRHAMNCFCFNPNIDTLRLNNDVSMNQCQSFFRKNECGILKQVRKMTIFGWSIHIDVVRDYLKSQLLAGIEVTVVRLLHCGRNCRCSTTELLEFGGLKEIMEAEGRDSGWMERIQALAEELASQFKETWVEHLGLPCPVIRAVAVCAKSQKTVSRQEIQRFRSAMSAGP